MSWKMNEEQPNGDYGVSIRIAAAVGFIAALGLSVPAWSQVSTAGAKAEGKALGGSGAAAAQGAAASPNLSDVPGYTTSNPPQTQYDSGNMYDAGVTESETNEAAQLLHGSFATRPEIEMEKSDPWLQKGWETSGDPHQVIDQFTGHYADCEEETAGGYPGSSEYRTCTEWMPFEEESCSIGWEVEVDAQKNYACYVGREFQSVTCTKTRVVTVTNADDCTGGTLFDRSYTFNGVWTNVGSCGESLPYHGTFRFRAVCTGSAIVVTGYHPNGSHQLGSHHWSGSGSVSNTGLISTILSGNECGSFLGETYGAMSHSLSCSQTSSGLNCSLSGTATIRSNHGNSESRVLSDSFTVSQSTEITETINDNCSAYK